MKCLEARYTVIGLDLEYCLTCLKTRDLCPNATPQFSTSRIKTLLEKELSDRKIKSILFEIDANNIS